MFFSIDNSNLFNHIPKYGYWLRLVVICLCLAIIATFVMMPMLLHGYPITHSTQFNLSWIFQYQRQFWSGQIYPRWLEFSNFGFGNPTFVFYPPMLAVATLPFSLLGMDLPTSLIGSMILAAFILALGSYLYASLYFPSWLSLVVAGLTVASPYFLIDIYQRGAIAEVWAITFIPWVLLATHKLISQVHLPLIQRSHAISLAIAWGMLGLSHLPTLLISFLAWLPMPLCLLTNLIKSNSLRRYIIEVGYCYLSASLGFVGISFFLIPVIFDQASVQIASINFSPEYLPQNRLLLDGLLSLHPKISTHWFETSSGLIPYFWILISVVIIAVLVNVFAKMERIPSQIELTVNQQILDQATFFWIFASAIAILMTTDLGSWIYQLSPTLQKIQFSWRWYGLTVTTVPILLVSLLWKIWLQTYPSKIAEKNTSLDTINSRLMTSDLKNSLKTLIKPLLVTFLLGSLIFASYIYTDRIVFQHTGFDPAIITKFSKLATQKLFPKEPNAEGEGTSILWWHWSFPDGLAIVDVPEYRAKGVTLQMPPPQDYPLAAWQEVYSNGHIQIKRWEYGLREILVDNPLPEPLHLDLRMFYYPAWQVWIDGQQSLLDKTSQGQVQIAIPNGQHLVLVKYAGTLAEKSGIAISWCSIILMSYISMKVLLRK